LSFLLSIRYIPLAIVCDGQKDMLKAIKQRFPGLIVQRCQFHVMQYCLAKLTQKPESQAAIELRELVLEISSIKSKERFFTWMTAYKYWYQTNISFLKEKTYQDYNLTPTGRKSWHYTHGKLHAAHSHLQNSFQNLFQYIKYPQIPNTSNRIEGGINARIQRHIDFHRGTNLFQRRQIIAMLLKQTQCGKLHKKPTRNFT